jgi:hypothetical protein
MNTKRETNPSSGIEQHERAKDGCDKSEQPFIKAGRVDREEPVQRLQKEMKVFVAESFMSEESLGLMDRSSSRQQYKIYDYACSDLYGEIDAIIAKCLLDGMMPAEESEMHEVMVEILDAAFECAVAIARPKENLRRLLEANCRKLADIAQTERHSDVPSWKGG